MFCLLDKDMRGLEGPVDPEVSVHLPGPVKGRGQASARARQSVPVGSSKPTERIFR